MTITFRGELLSSGFGVIIQRDLLLLRHVLLGDNLNAYMIFSPCEKGNTCLTKLIGGLSYEKIWRYNMAAMVDSPFRFP